MILTSQGAVLRRQVAQTKPDRADRAVLAALAGRVHGGGATVFKAEEIMIIKTPVQAPRANAIMERWVGSLRREVLDRILIVNAEHLRKVLAKHEAHFNTHWPHRSLEQASRLRALPDPITADIKVIRHDWLGGLLHEDSQVA